MSNETKYGEKELKLINDIIDTYKKIDNTFFAVENGNIYLQNERGRDRVFKVKNQNYDYINFVIEKILKDNFDEDFVKEKLKNQ